MFERFTEANRNAIQLATGSAVGEVTPGNVLLGLLLEGDGLAARILAEFGYTPENVHDRLTPTRRPVWTKDASDILEGALREALSLGHNYVGTEHTLLALLDSGGETGLFLAPHAERIRQHIKANVDEKTKGRLTTELKSLRVRSRELETMLGISHTLCPYCACEEACDCKPGPCKCDCGRCGKP